MTTASDDDIPDLVDILDSEHLDAVWFTRTFSLTLPKINNTQIYGIHTVKTGC